MDRGDRGTDLIWVDGLTVTRAVRIDATAPRSGRSRGSIDAPSGDADGHSLAWLAVILTLDGPGLTVDEPLDVRPGRAYLTILWKEGGISSAGRSSTGSSATTPSIRRLGRWLLGIASVLGEPFEVLLKGPDPTGYYVLAGRLAPALAFGLLVGP